MPPVPPGLVGPAGGTAIPAAPKISSESVLPAGLFPAAAKSNLPAEISTELKKLEEEIPDRAQQINSAKDFLAFSAGLSSEALKFALLAHEELGALGKAVKPVKVLLRDLIVWRTLGCECAVHRDALEEGIRGKSADEMISQLVNSHKKFQTHLLEKLLLDDKNISCLAREITRKPQCWSNWKLLVETVSKMSPEPEAEHQPSSDAAADESESKDSDTCSVCGPDVACGSGLAQHSNDNAEVRLTAESPKACMLDSGLRVKVKNTFLDVDWGDKESLRPTKSCIHAFGRRSQAGTEYYTGASVGQADGYTSWKQEPEQNYHQKGKFYESCSQQPEQKNEFNRDVANLIINQLKRESDSAAAARLAGHLGSMMRGGPPGPKEQTLWAEAQQVLLEAMQRLAASQQELKDVVVALSDIAGMNFLAVASQVLRCKDSCILADIWAQQLERFADTELQRNLPKLVQDTFSFAEGTHLPAAAGRLCQALGVLARSCSDSSQQKDILLKMYELAGDCENGVAELVKLHAKRSEMLGICMTDGTPICSEIQQRAFDLCNQIMERNQIKRGDDLNKSASACLLLAAHTHEASEGLWQELLKSGIADPKICEETVREILEALFAKLETHIEVFAKWSATRTTLEDREDEDQEDQANRDGKVDLAKDVLKSVRKQQFDLCKNGLQSELLPGVADWILLNYHERSPKCSVFLIGLLWGERAVLCLLESMVRERQEYPLGYALRALQELCYLQAPDAELHFEYLQHGAFQELYDHFDHADRKLHCALAGGMGVFCESLAKSNVDERAHQVVSDTLATLIEITKFKMNDDRFPDTGFMHEAAWATSTILQKWPHTIENAAPDISIFAAWLEKVFSEQINAGMYAKQMVELVNQNKYVIC
eukprot:TRINITY_DN8553_c0_g1_i1.p1 TRINITY_DN8553_c0_g1~~TRINITY_DN8553_c0_g1_i1.p1  ORF type:complete len:886 (-),score=171.69 TRINITY_DN8553_c0_g1_i1:356-3013(-)